MYLRLLIDLYSVSLTYMYCYSILLFAFCLFRENLLKGIFFLIRLIVVAQDFNPSLQEQISVSSRSPSETLSQKLFYTFMHVYV